MTKDERAALIEQRARELIKAIYKNLDTKPWPVCYGTPYGEALRLKQALDEDGEPFPGARLVMREI